ncbi:MAG: response regulator [Alphaproteobacteria bacterium]|nr:response regulator [Alphaproteobacteria bacterium]
MAKPAIVAVDDDPDVLRAVARDLREHFNRDYRILSAASGAEALEVVRTLKLRNQPLALFLADQRMPDMTGIEFLAEAAPLFPTAKRVLLTAYADKDVAIRAINEVQLDYYLMKPWEPPGQLLYPALDDLLLDWRACFRPPFEGVTVVDHRWSKRGFEIRDFLARNHIPYRRLDVERDAEAQALLALAGGGDTLPLVVLPDGRQLVRPGIGELADLCGGQRAAGTPFYDLVVVGGGPAGLAAAVYGASEGLRTLVVESEAPGGQAGTSSRIENYLGFPNGLSGSDLSRRALTQAQRLGAEFLVARQATGLRVEGPYRFVKLSDGSEISSHALIIASGVQYRRLDVPGATALEGAGVFYGAAMTEASACKDQDVYIIGGGNSAGQAAIFLAVYARSVTILIRGRDLTASMSHYLIERIGQSANIAVMPHTEVARVAGASALESLTLRDNRAGTEETRPAHGLFVFIGAEPRTDWLGETVVRDARGYIVTGRDLQGSERRGVWQLERDPFITETSVPGVFAAGDVRQGSVKRVAAAVGEGSITVSFVHAHLETL